MKSLLLATDLIKTPTGELKVLEINTNARLSQPFDNAVHNLNNLIPFLQSNGFQSVHCIYPRNSNPFAKALKIVCDNLGIEFINYETASDAVTVPYIEDDETKLIIRVSYDTTAIVDDDYCRDKFKLQSVINQKTYAAKTYIPNELDNFNGIEDFIYNENVPNFIVKKRYPNYDKEVFPKLYKVENLSQLQTLKNSIEEDCYLQEFIESELIYEKKSIIRSLDLLYGPNLDVLNLCSFYRTNKLAENIWENTFDENGLLHKKDRFKYVSHALNDASLFEEYVYDVDQEVVMADGTKKTFDSIVIGDQLKSVHIEGLPLQEGGYYTTEWRGNYQEFINNFSLVDTQVTDVYESNPISQLFLRITLNDGLQWDDLQDSHILFKDGELIRFKMLMDVNVGDDMIFVNFETNQAEIKTIQSIEVIYKEEQKLGWLGVEPIDVYLPLIGPVVAIIQHNICDKGCKSNVCADPTLCEDCSKSFCGLPQK